MKGLVITIIDDETDILDLLKYNFELERFHVHTFTSGQEALTFIRSSLPHVIVCDWMLEDINGIDICRILKNDETYRDIPFIMLTARDNEVDAVTALELGADDYIAKPVRVKELISRVKKRIDISNRNPLQLTKKEELNSRSHGVKIYKKLTIDEEKFKAYLDRRELKLTHSEFKLLFLLISKPGKVFSRNQIIESLNGVDYLVTERSIDVQLVGLRKKLFPYKDYLETVRGIGYRLRE